MPSATVSNASNRVMMRQIRTFSVAFGHRSDATNRAPGACAVSAANVSVDVITLTLLGRASITSGLAGNGIRAVAPARILSRLRLLGKLKGEFGNISRAMYCQTRVYVQSRMRG